MSRFISEFMLGIKAYKHAYRFTHQHQLWRFYWIPAMINLLIFISIASLGWHYETTLINYLRSFVHIPQVPIWANQVIDFFIVLLLRLVAIILFVKLYRFIIIILLSPILGIVAEKVQLIVLQANEPKFDIRTLIHNIIRGLRLSIGNIFIELTITIPLMLLGLFIPFLAPFTTIFILLTESYFIGFSAMDLRNEFVKLSGKESKKVIWRRKGASIGNGIVFNGLLLIPVIGILFAPIFSVVAGNLAIHDLEKINPTVPIRLE